MKKKVAGARSKDAVLLDYIARSAALDAAPRTAKKRAPQTIAVPKTPSDFAASLAAVPIGRAVFDRLREGKARNWKCEGAGSEAKASARVATARASLREAEGPSKKLKKAARKTAKKATTKKSVTKRTMKKR